MEENVKELIEKLQKEVAAMQEFIKIFIERISHTIKSLAEIVGE